LAIALTSGCSLVPIRMTLAGKEMNLLSQKISILGAWVCHTPAGEVACLLIGTAWLAGVPVPHISSRLVPFAADPSLADVLSIPSFSVVSHTFSQGFDDGLPSIHCSAWTAGLLNHASRSYTTTSMLKDTLGADRFHQGLLLVIRYFRLPSKTRKRSSRLIGRSSRKWIRKGGQPVLDPVQDFCSSLTL
jgi:hypothetical protein